MWAHLWPLCLPWFLVPTETLGFFKEKTPPNWIYLKFANSLPSSQSSACLWEMLCNHRTAVRPCGGEGALVVAEGEQQKWNHRSQSHVHVHICLLLLTPLPMHHQRSASLWAACQLCFFPIQFKTNCKMDILGRKKIGRRGHLGQEEGHTSIKKLGVLF